MTVQKIQVRAKNERPRRLRRIPTGVRVLVLGAAAAATLAACGSSGSSGSTGSANNSTSTGSPAAASTTSMVKTATIGGATVLTNGKGFTLYWFAPDTSTMSKCNGACAQNWPPVTGKVSASGVSGTFGTITRSDGATQATFDGHPLYTFVGDSAPGKAEGNGLNEDGGVWHEVTASGGAAPAPSKSSSSSSSGGGGGYGY